MSLQPIISLRAKKDLLNIGRYTQKKWGKSQRNKYLKEIDKCLNRLSKNPNLGIHRPEIKSGYYSYPIGSHIIFYLKERKRIIIIGIPHQAMDITNQF